MNGITLLITFEGFRIPKSLPWSDIKSLTFPVKALRLTTHGSDLTDVY